MIDSTGLSFFNPPDCRIYKICTLYFKRLSVSPVYLLLLIQKCLLQAQFGIFKLWLEL